MIDSLVGNDWRSIPDGAEGAARRRESAGEVAWLSPVHLDIRWRWGETKPKARASCAARRRVQQEELLRAPQVPTMRGRNQVLPPSAVRPSAP